MLRNASPCSLSGLLLPVILLVITLGCQPEKTIRPEKSISPGGDAAPAISQVHPVTEYYYPPATGSTWETVGAASLGWNVTKLNEAVAYAGQNQSTAFIILHKGRIVSETYWRGWNSSSAAVIASATKSIAATLCGLTQQQGQLSIGEPVSKYLGKGWSKAPGAKEDLIQVRHLLAMTSGLDDSLRYVADAGTRWFYGNAAYHQSLYLLDRVSGKSRDALTRDLLGSRIGLQHSAWRIDSLAGINTMASSGRDMARFGLFILSKGAWAGEQILTDTAYFNAMTNTSQPLNRSYGYLWWLNGKSSFMLPSGDSGETSPVYNRTFIPAAPPSLIAALGRGDKKIYVVPAKDLVIIRHGSETGTPAAALSSFDNQLWTRLSAAIP